jgi:hypothetical protein
MNRWWSCVVVVIVVALDGSKGIRLGPSGLGYAADAVSLELVLTANRPEIEIDLFGKSAEEFRALLEEWAGTDKLPAQEVDFTLELKNRTDKPVVVRLWNGDGAALTWTLKGPGVFDVAAVKDPPAGRVEPLHREIAPGKSVAFPIKALLHGKRGVERRMYFTEAGEYRLTARMETQAAVFDARREVQPNFQPLVLESKAVEVKVSVKER